MFDRQWFSGQSQFGLSPDSLYYERLLRSKSFSEALSFSSSRLSDSNSQPLTNYWNRQRCRCISLKNFHHTSDTVIKISFKNFWSGFNVYNNEILNFFIASASLIGLEVNVCQSNPDIVVYSCFGTNQPNSSDTPGATRFLYLGENVRPSYTDFDYSLSFDLDTYNDRNIHLPLWVLRTSKYAISNSDYEPIPIDSLTSYKKLSTNRSKICYIGNNYVPNRIDAVNVLRDLGFDVDIFGSHTKPIKSKHDTLKNYRYTLCFENSYYPGYITEKLFDTFSAGSIPIYWGFSNHLDLNPKSYFQCSPLISLRENLSYLKSWDNINNNRLPPLFEKSKLYSFHQKVKASLSKHIFNLFL